MAIQSYVGAEIDTNVNTWQNLIDLTNDIVGDLGSTIISVGDNNTGDVAIDGVFSANTVYVGSELSGGVQGTPSAMTISSNTSFSGQSVNFGTTVATVHSGNLTFNGPTKTLLIDNANTTIRANELNIESDTTFSGGMSVTGDFSINNPNTTITSDSLTLESNTSISGTLGVGTNDPVGGAIFHALSNSSLVGVFESETFACSVIFGNDLGSSSIISNVNNFTVNTGVGGYFSVEDNNSERFRITSDGKVGIGTTDPGSELDVFGVGDIIRSTSNNDSSNFMAFFDETGRKGYFGYGSASEDMTLANERLGYLAFQTNNSERLRIDSAGNVGIGTTSPSEVLEVSGNILASGDITAFSDGRLKENVVSIDNALNKVTNLRGVYYNRVGEEDQKIGVIAQEVEKILPEVVSEHDNGIKSVSYGNMVGILIEAIKEQQNKIDDLVARIDELEK